VRATAPSELASGGSEDKTIPHTHADKREKDKDAPFKYGYFNHLFRAQSFSYQINLVRSTIAVAKDRGIENPSTLAHYYTGSWREHAEDLKK